MLKIYHNPRCSKSRLGLEMLKNSGEKFQIIDYLKNRLSEEELGEIISFLGIPAEEMVRKNEPGWKETYSGKSLSEAEIIRAMANDPKLIERPIVVKNGKAVIGRPTEKIKILLNHEIPQ